MNEKDTARYQARGVSASKADVHKAVAHIDKGLFPTAFCKITEDFLTGDPEKCSVIHSDGSGTKSILAYLYYKETGDVSVFEGIAQDSIVMNIDDLLCVGVTDRMLLSSTINRNAKTCGAEVIEAVIHGNETFINTMRDFGLNIINGGGETADMGDVVRTISVDTCAVAGLNRADVIQGGIVPGLSIVGLSSTGTAAYEKEENSGVGSNGLTSARHDMLSPYYRENFPEAYAPEVDPELVYCGPFRLSDPLPGSSLTVGKALLSPTRTYAPLIHRLLSERRDDVKGLIHCTGGAQTKCHRFGNKVHFIKDQLFDIPPLFAEIRKASGTSLKEMYQVYNMGHRMEIYCKPDNVDSIIEFSAQFGIAAQEIGHTEQTLQNDGASHVTIRTEGQEITY